MNRRYEVKDLSLAAAGRARVAEAEARLPVLAAVRERFAAERPLGAFRVSACLHVTAEAAGLLRTLQAGGADVLVAAAGASSTQDDVAAVLVEDLGIATFAVRGVDADGRHAQLEAAVDHKPHLVLDDGAELIGLLHSARREQLGEVVAATERSPTGLLRLRALAEDGTLGFPVVAVGEAAVARLAAGRQGAGRAAVDELAGSGAALAGRRLAVLGYGAAGAGAAARAHELGAVVTVCEQEPLLALEAALDGFPLAPADEALATADAVVVADATGALGRRQKESLQAGAVVVAVDAARTPAAADLELALQALAAEDAIRRAASLERRVHAVPEEIDAEVARLGLAALTGEGEAP